MNPGMGPAGVVLRDTPPHQTVHHKVVSDLRQMSERKLWSAMSPHELLDLAQEYFDRDAPEACRALLAAAQIQSTENLSWSMENRLAMTLGNAIWEARR